MRFFQMLRGQGRSSRTASRTLNRVHYVKEIFGDSDTVMAVISGVPTRDWDKNPLPPDQMVATRDVVNDLAGAQRVLSHGLLRPNLGAKELDEMERQVKELKIDAWKMYTGAELGEKAWCMDDEKVAYPFWEKTHAARRQEPLRPQGAAAGALQREALPAARPGEGGQGLAATSTSSSTTRLPRLRRPTGRPAGKAKTDDPQEIPWISDMLPISRRTRRSRTSTSSWAARSTSSRPSHPKTCLHMLGQMIQVAGADHILWGTDSHLERQPAEPDRAPAAAEDEPRS